MNPAALSPWCRQQAVRWLGALVLLALPSAAQTRVEFHLLPATTTGPMDPAWSPDGAWIAFSMRGDIWKVPAAGGTAVQLTSGPAVHYEPAWSPDGHHLAVVVEEDGIFDLAWIPADGLAAGEQAPRLTDDPHLDLQPAWSAGGDAIYFTRRLEPGPPSAAGEARSGDPRAKQRARPTRARGDLDLYVLPVERRDASADTPNAEGDEPRATSLARPTLAGASAPRVVMAGEGHQFFPAPSAGGTLAWVGRLAGRLGSGVVWTKRQGGPSGDPAMEPRVVIDEETSYRTAPQWSPDGAHLLYSTDEAGSSDIALTPATGGQRVRLTEDPFDEFAPAFSPDGREIVFVSNRHGASELYRLSAGGGATSAWRKVEITGRKHLVPTGRVRGRIVGPGGDPTPARLLATGSDGRGYAEDGGFLRRFWNNDTHYSHVGSTFELELPAGPAELVAMRGFEYLPAEATVDVPAGGTTEVELRLERLVDLPARGWFSGDTHTHDLHEGRYGLTQQEFFAWSRADDLHVTNALIHMDGTKLMGRWSDLTGEPYLAKSAFGSSEAKGARARQVADAGVARTAAATGNDQGSAEATGSGKHDNYILQYSQEFRGSFGHVALLGLRSFVMPLIGGTPGSPFSEDVLKVKWLEAVREQGGIGGYVHPYNGPAGTPQEVGSMDIPLHVALGLGSFYDVISIASKEWPSLSVYYRFLNTGFRLAATGGTDNFSDAFRDPSPGTARTYAHVPGELTFGKWLDAVKSARTFASSGPLLDFRVNGEHPGSTIELLPTEALQRIGPERERQPPREPRPVEFELELTSIVPIEAVEFIVNGEVALRMDAGGDGPTWTYQGVLEVPEGGWVAARAFGPPHPLIGDEFPFAHTSPIWVTREGKSWRSANDARFLFRAIESLWQRVQRRDRFQTEASRARYEEAVEQALATLRAIEESAE